MTSTALECRNADGALAVRGYASTTGQAYDMGWYNETIARGAFAKTLSETPDVQLLINHEGLPLARTTNGTLDLREDQQGLYFEARLDGDDPDAARVIRKIEAGLMDQCSFAFRVTRQTWDDDYENRSIDEVSLDRGDVSVVNYGANPHTSVSLRSLFVDLADLDEDKINELRADETVMTVVRKLVVPAPVTVSVEAAADPAEVAEEVREALKPATVHDLDVYRARAFALRLNQK